MKIILKIKKNRNRPCHQNILTFVNRGGSDINMDRLKEVLNNLIVNNLIRNNGKEGRESFCVIDEQIDEQNNDSDDDIEERSLDVSNEDNIDDNLMEDININENSVISDSLKSYINDKFYETLINKIKSEVKIAVDSEFYKKTVLSRNPQLNELNTVNINADNCVNYNNTNDVLLKTLNSEIKFLRDEVSSKDSIIRLLINERDKSNICENVLNKETSYNKLNDKESKNKTSVNKSCNKIYGKGDKKVINGEDGNINQREGVSQFETVKSKKRTTKKRSTTVIGDSILKDIKPFKMRQSLKNQRIYIKSFPGSTIDCMKDYIKPSLKYDPDAIIIHIGTNDLRTEKEPTQIADEIINLALAVKTDENEVSISAILPRNVELDDKGKMVNDVLKIKCSKYAIGFMSNSNFIPNLHLNSSGLHLNFKGTTTLAKNLLDHINL